jgi:hypothetical protein
MVETVRGNDNIFRFLLLAKNISAKVGVGLSAYRIFNADCSIAQ